MSLMFVGRLGKSTLAGVSLSISFGYVTGFTVLDTLCFAASVNTSSLVWMLPFGLSTAMSTRDSNELRANQSNAAKLATEVVIFVVLARGILVASFLDGIHCVLSGIARGGGWQKIGSIINLGSCYILGVPCAVVLGFVLHPKSKGLRMGVVSAFAVQVICFSILRICTNWEEEAEEAVIRVQNQRVAVEGSNGVVMENPV